MNSKKIEQISEDKAELLVDALEKCTYCGEPFKECDTLIPGQGLIVGQIDIVKYAGSYWHYGCVHDYEKEDKSS